MSYPLDIARFRLRRGAAAGLAAVALLLLLLERHETLHALTVPASFEPSYAGAGHPAQAAHLESSEERVSAPCVGCLIQLRSTGRLASPPHEASRLIGATDFSSPDRARPTLSARTFASPRAPPAA